MGNQYENCTFELPSQSRENDVTLCAKKLVVSGNDLYVPKAITPARSRPLKNAGKQLKGWYERRPEARKKR